MEIFPVRTDKINTLCQTTVWIITAITILKFPVRVVGKKYPNNCIRFCAGGYTITEKY